MTIQWQEWVGYAASLLVAASLMMSNVRRLRWVNLAGALAFTLYGVLVRAWPVAAVNLFVAGVDAYYLAQMGRRSDFFALLPVRCKDPLVRKFLAFYREDLARFFPSLTEEALCDATGFFVLRNLLPVGLFAHLARPEGRVEILVDYVIPEYRDRKNAEFVFRTFNAMLAAEGHREFVIRSSVPAHQAYLVREGFQPVAGEAGVYRKAII